MIVIGASSGGLKALQTLLKGLPRHFPETLAVVLHRQKDGEDSLCPALQRHCPLPVAEAVDKEPIVPGRVIVAPADYHLLVEPDCFSLSTDDVVHYARPSIDVLFESAADVFGPAAIGVVLTGANKDGARGAAQIHKRGGTVVVQDPATAESPAMPSAALAETPLALCRPLEEIAATLVQLTQSMKTSKA